MTRQSGVILRLLSGGLIVGHRGRLADNPVRDQLMRIVRQRPGIPLGVLRKELGVGWGTLYHHLLKLANARMLEQSTQGRRTLVYPVGQRRLHDTAAQALLHGETARRVALAIQQHPGSSISHLVSTLDESPRVVYYHVRRLLAAELVTSLSPTRHVALRSTPRLSLLLCRLADGAATAEHSAGDAGDASP